MLCQLRHDPTESCKEGEPLPQAIWRYVGVPVLCWSPELSSPLWSLPGSMVEKLPEP